MIIITIVAILKRGGCYEKTKKNQVRFVKLDPEAVADFRAKFAARVAGIDKQDQAEYRARALADARIKRKTADLHGDL
ncbi:MAG: hypothetical protein WDZ88_03780 [Candidatus Paceibacterota bacterium]